MTHLIRGGVLLVAVLALAASASAPKQHTFEKSRVTPASYDQTWSSVIEVFADRNWAIQNLEKDSGLITTDWMSVGSDSGFADCGGAGLAIRQDRQVRFNVLVAEIDGGARVTVNATLRELRLLDHSQFWVDCTSTGKVEDMIHGLVDGSIASHARRARPARAVARVSPDDDESEAGSSPGGSAAGTEGGTCYGNATCNAGLVCDDATRCIVAPAPAP